MTGFSPTRTALAALVSFGLACGVAGCATTAEPQDELLPTLAVDAAKVTVLDPGTGPLEKVAYSPTTVSDATQDITLAQGFDQQLGDTSTDTAAPAGGDVVGLSTPITVSQIPASSEQAVTADNATGPAPDEDARQITITLGKGRFDDITRADAVQTAAEGFRLRMNADPDGQVRTVGLEAPAAASDEGRAAVESLIMSWLATPVVFPKEPIGVGARWSVDNRVPGSNALLQSTTWTLVKRDGQRVELAADITQRPTQTALSLEGVGGEGTITALSTNSTSDAHLTVDLDQPLPVSGQLAVTTRIIYGQEDSPTRVVQDHTTAVTYGNR